ncbi:NADP-dependent phosphogluconate dehydrogenase [Frateuria sp. GZRe14]|uniref:NADP-dependent phosphogluconate dehydrogenase n=1 Tax=Frateuria sp. GZRe14 TaxID=3351534 RepID=UPI003EDBC9A0
MSLQVMGVFGMGVMGRSLALNIESRGHAVSVYDHDGAFTDQVMAAHPDRRLVAFHELPGFVASLERPRRILLMIKAGPPVDAMLEALKPLLEAGDIVIDGGNSYYRDTIRREQAMQAAGLNFIGCGISGGEEGALHGPSIMPGGPREAYAKVEPILTEIAARAPDGTPCVAWMGPNGAGHYVKMVHNGIEYGDMQLIAESYAMLRQVLGLSNAELARIYADWNRGELDSYLIGITSHIFTRKDPDTGNDLVDMILDRAAQKGTGQWTCQDALEMRVPLPLITEAVFARGLSAQKDERMAASRVLHGPAASFAGDRTAFVESVRRALYLGKLVSYAQGFAQLRAASAAHDWDLDYATIASIFRAGCIIRAGFLERIMEAYARDPALSNLMLDPYFADVAREYQEALREVVGTAVRQGVAVPCLASAIAWFDGYRSEQLPANLLQAQRDYFGAHTFERVDRPGSFHVDWE